MSGNAVGNVLADGVKATDNLLNKAAPAAANAFPNFSGARVTSRAPRSPNALSNDAAAASIFRDGGVKPPINRPHVVQPEAATRTSPAREGLGMAGGMGLGSGVGPLLASTMGLQGAMTGATILGQGIETASTMAQQGALSVVTMRANNKMNFQSALLSEKSNLNAAKWKTTAMEANTKIQ